MTNDKTVTMSRKWAKVLADTFQHVLASGKPPTFSSGDLRFLIEKLTLLAAPVVERQEPVAWVDPYSLTRFSENEKQWVRIPVSLAENRANGYTHPLYTSPSEPVAVVLPARPLNQGKLFDRMSSYEKGIVQGSAEMWDKIKELNQ